MNSAKLQQLLDADLFIDLELTLVDDIEELIMNLHKNILYIPSEYFEKLLTGFQEQKLNKITMKVPNVNIMYDIIMGFYLQKSNKGAYPEWRCYLESIKCLDFLGLTYDLNKLYNLKVPSEGFELLLEVVGIVEYDSRLAKVIIDNLPENYDLSKLSNELIKEMITESHFGICIFGFCIAKSKKHTQNVSTIDICYANVNVEQSLKIISGSADKSIKIWDAKLGEIINTLNGHTDWVRNVCISSFFHVSIFALLCFHFCVAKMKYYNH